MSKAIMAAAVASVAALREQLVAISNRETEILDAAEADGRELTAEENAELGELKAKFEATEGSIKRREEIEARREKLNAAQPRVTRPGDIEASGRITGGEATDAKRRTFGFGSLGEFMASVRAARTGAIDPRLNDVRAAATTYGNESNNADGGFAVPPDFRDQIMKKVGAEEGLLARTDQQYTTGNSMTVPIDETAPWDSTGGIQAYWEDEAQKIAESKPSIGQIEVKLKKVSALVPLTDELLEDSTTLGKYLPGKVSDKFTQKINGVIVNGNGVGKPQGLLAAGSKVAVAKESGQAAGTIVYANITKMWARMLAALRPGAVWLINQDIEPQLLNLIAPGGTVPAYMPPNGISGSPFATLLGRPVVPVETCETVGTEGDIVLANLSTYLTLQKTTGGVKQDVSMHLYFDQQLTAFRFVMRLGGQSWWRSPITREKGSNSLSNVVTLATR